MSCQHGNHVDDCDLCNELLAEYRSGIKSGREEGWEACEMAHGIVEGKHREAESLRQQLSDSQKREMMLRDALKSISVIEDKLFGPDWEEIDEARDIATEALAATEPTK